jgi:hypothetical protein
MAKRNYKTVTLTPGFHVLATQDTVIDALVQAYELGSSCAKEINSGRAWTDAKTNQERAALNRVLKGCGIRRLSDDEYERFCK